MSDENKFEDSVVSEIGYQKATEKGKSQRNVEIDDKYKKVVDEISKEDVTKESNDVER